VGPPRPEYGEPEESLSRRRLPQPLRRLYAFAGRWPPQNGLYDDDSFGVEDYLRKVPSIETTADGKIVFLAENQGVWRCATQPEGNDPPVWCDAEHLRSENEEQQWVLVSDSLARFLVTYCLKELGLGARFRSTDKALIDLFQADEENAIPILTTGAYVTDDVPRYYLYKNRTLVAKAGNWVMLSANHRDAIAYLEGNQSPIVAAQLYVPPGWRLEIRQDGSAELRSWSVTSPAVVRLPRGTLDFVALISRLQASCLDLNRKAVETYFTRPDRERVQFHLERAGGPSFTRPRFSTDWKFVQRLFEQALAAAVKDEAFERQLAEKPPFE